MSPTFEPLTGILPSAQKGLWPHLRPVRDLGFVLYGGTAIALRLGHRASVDFDFFSDQPLDKNRLREELPFLRTALVLQDNPNTLSVLVSVPSAGADPVKVSFFGSIAFGRVGESQRTEDGILQVASVEDLMAHKLKVLLQRVEAKDYLDIAALLNSGMRLDSGLAAARALYGTTFQPAESLKALVFFEGGDLSTLSANIRQCLVQAVKMVHALPIVTVRSNRLS